MIGRRASVHERAMLMGGACAKAYGWSPKTRSALVVGLSAIQHAPMPMATCRWSGYTSCTGQPSPSRGQSDRGSSGGLVAADNQGEE